MLIVRNHCNIVELKDIFTTNEYVYLVMERLDMNLYTYLKKYHHFLTVPTITFILE